MAPSILKGQTATSGEPWFPSSLNASNAQYRLFNPRAWLYAPSCRRPPPLGSLLGEE
ncbi:hypothetical protein PCASD_22491 [Puccinia coronata f. sp. avenae]|uniref:Uncharacterized protein n=1 Tax=Puccinia coronata f. sp. avenae TaxID=200324 RepID=A0A2N5TRP3_9BASI|nr:hypothetical protein PCASD_22491 [Puccinia coronata f. sp. avenae]